MTVYFQDKKADLIINFFADEVMSKVMKRLSLEIPEYSSNNDPTKELIVGKAMEWNINKTDIKSIKIQYDKRHKEYRKRKSQEKVWRKNSKMIKSECLIKTKVEKEEITSNTVDLTLDLSEDDIFTE